MKLYDNRGDGYVITPVDHPDIVPGPDGGFEVDDPDLAKNLLMQGDNYRPGDDEARSIADEIEAEREVHDEVVAADTTELTARELIASLDTLTADELADVRNQEVAGKARTTVLNRIDELLAPQGGEGQEV